MRLPGNGWPTVTAKRVLATMTTCMFTRMPIVRAGRRHLVLSVIPCEDVGIASRRWA
jgi:hypothetical protein